MGIRDKLFGGKDEAETHKTPHGIPTVKFDRLLVTATIKADMKQNIAELHHVPKKHYKAIYWAALGSILRGRGLKTYRMHFMQKK